MKRTALTTTRGRSAVTTPESALHWSTLRARALGVVLALCLPTASVAAAGAASLLPATGLEAATEKKGVGPIDQLVLDARRSGASVTDLTKAFVQHGKRSRNDLFDVLAADAVQIRVGERGRAAEPLTSDERNAVVTAFSRLPIDSVRKLLQEQMEAGPGQRARLASMELLASFGRPGDLDRLLDWAQTEGTEVRVPHSVRNAFGERLGQFLLRNPELLRRIPALYRRANLSLLPAILSALGSQPGRDRADAIGDLLGAEPRFDAHVLAEISALTKNARFAASDRLTQRVRTYLSSTDRSHRIEAISIVAQIGDGRAIPPLIELIGESDKDLRRRALAALSEITGEQLEPSAETWRSWHTAITNWWASDSQDYLERARNGNPGIASRAIQELSMLRMYRHQLVAPLADVLEREEVEIVVLTSAALGHLGAIESVPHLVRLLEKENVDIRRGAYHALRRLTGENYSDDAAAWRAAGWGEIPH